MNRVQAPPPMIAVGSAIMLRSGNMVPGLREPFHYGQAIVAGNAYRPGTMAPRVPTRLAGPDRSLGVSRIATGTYAMVRAGFERGGAAGTRGARTIMDRGMARIPVRASPAAGVIAFSEAVTGPAGMGRAETYREGQARLAARIPRRYAGRMGSLPFFWGGVSRTSDTGLTTNVPGFLPKTTNVMLPAGAVLPLPGSPGYAGSTSIRTPTPSPLNRVPQAGSTDLRPFLTTIDPAPTTIAPTPVSSVPADPGSATVTSPLEQTDRYQGAMEKAGSSDLVDAFPSPSWTPPPPPPPPEEPAPGLSTGAKVTIGVLALLAIGAAAYGGKGRRR